MKKLMHVQEFLMVSWFQLAGTTKGHYSFTATTAILTRISKNIGSRVQYLQCMEKLHARNKSSLTSQLHQRRSVPRRRE